MDSRATSQNGCDLAGERVDGEGAPAAARRAGPSGPIARARNRAARSSPASGRSTIPPASARSVSLSWSATIEPYRYVVVDRRGGDVDLRRPVRRLPTLRRRELLVAGDELPPRGVEVSVGIRVQDPLEPGHDEHPAREDEAPPPSPRAARAQRLGLARVDPAHSLEPLAVAAEGTEQVPVASVVTRCVSRRSHGSDPP